MMDLNELKKYSDADEAQRKAFEYLGKDAHLYLSPKKDKKYRIFNPLTDKYVDFGQIGYEDFTKHKDEQRRKRYLSRATNMKGEWRDNPYSANNLSIHILW